jgi:hypothetical protein
VTSLPPPGVAARVSFPSKNQVFLWLPFSNGLESSLDCDCALFRCRSIARGDTNLNYELLGATRELDECREECERLVLNISLAIESLLSLAFINSAVTVDSLAKQKASRAEASDALKVLTERDPQDMWTHRAVERAATNISSALSRLQYEQGVLSSIHSQAGRTNEEVLKR